MLSYVSPAPWEDTTYHAKRSLATRPVRESHTSPFDDGSGYLYHTVFTTSNLTPTSDPNSQVTTLQICGTFTTLKSAVASARRTLWDAGYEREMFIDYETKETEFEEHHVTHREGLAVLAKAKDATEFRVSVSRGNDIAHLRMQTENIDDDHKIFSELYHVVKTIIAYNEDESGTARDNIVEASFTSYAEARKIAGQALLLGAKGVAAKSKEDFAQYDEAEGNEKDCGFGENVVVRAVTDNGANFLISVVKGQEMESVRLAEAARRAS